MMERKLTLGLIWVTFVLYTIKLAPLDKPDTYSLVWKLLTLQWGKLNPIILAIFTMMGVWPMIYASLMFPDGRMQNVRAWPSFLGSNFTGVIGLMPYLLLRERNQEFSGELDQVLKFFEKRSTGITLLTITLTVLIWVAITGDWDDYWEQFHNRAFVHLISIDFLLMALTFPITSLLDDDMARRGWNDPLLFWLIALVPLFGPLAYLCVRPSLEESQNIPTSTTPLPG